MGRAIKRGISFPIRILFQICLGLVFSVVKLYDAVAASSYTVSCKWVFSTGFRTAVSTAAAATACGAGYTAEIFQVTSKQGFRCMASICACSSASMYGAGFSGTAAWDVNKETCEPGMDNTPSYTGTATCLAQSCFKPCSSYQYNSDFDTCTSCPSFNGIVGNSNYAGMRAIQSCYIGDGATGSTAGVGYWAVSGVCYYQ